MDASCETLFDVLLQPYWLHLLGFLFTTLLSVVIKLIQFAIKKSWGKQVFDESDVNLELSEASGFDWNNFAEAVFTPSLLVLVPQSMLQIAHFGYAIYFIYYSSWGPWNRYQALGTIMMNSGLLNNITQVWVYRFLAGNRGKYGKKKMGLILLVPQVLVLSPFLIHSIAAVVMYIWIIIPLVFLLSLLFCFFLDRPRAIFVLGLVWIRLTPFVCTLVLQTGYNYMVLYYNSTSYIGVISKEWDLRDTYCYETNLATSAQHVWAFTTYIF